MSNITPTPPSFAFSYWRPWKEGSNEFDSFLDYTKDISLAKYQADTVGQYISQASSEQVQAIGELGDKIGMASYEQIQAIEQASFEQTQAIGQASYEQVQAIGLASYQQVQAIRELGKEIGMGLYVLSNQMSEVNENLNFVNRNLDIQIEQQRVTNLLLEDIKELLRVPDSEKERQHSIELGLKFFINAQKDDDLFADALEELLEAEKLMKQDYFVLHRIGLIYLYSAKHIDPPKALGYFERAAKYASVESDPKAKRLANVLAQYGDRANTKIVTDTNAIGSLAADSYEKAAFVSYILGNFELAVAHQSKAVKYHNCAENYFFLAKYLTRTKQIDLCVDNLEKSIDIKPEMFTAVFKDLDLLNEPQVLNLLNEKNNEIDHIVLRLKDEWENSHTELAHCINPKLIDAQDARFDIKGNTIKMVNSLIEYSKRNWAVENLDVSYFRNGDKIFHAKTPEELIEASKNSIPACCYYDNDPTIGSKYGMLYNIFAVTDPRGLAPFGWFIPNINDWKKIIELNGGGGREAQKNLKSESGWDLENNGTNKSGLGLLPGGSFSYKMFFHVGRGGHWWCKSEILNDKKGCYFSIFDFDEVDIWSSKSCDPWECRSVRCFSENLIDKEILKFIEEFESVQSAGAEAFILELKDALNASYDKKVEIVNLAFENNNRNWANTNLNVRYFRNGDEIPEVSSFSEWLKAGEERKPAWCHYNNDPANGKKYGKLYNWYAVNDPRGLAPIGWYIPSQDQWESIKKNSIQIIGIDGCGFLDVKHGFMNFKTDYWSSSKVDSILDSAHCQEFRNGTLVSHGSISNKTDGFSVHCESESKQIEIIDNEIHSLIIELETVQTDEAKAIIIELRGVLKASYDKKVETANSVYESNSLNWTITNLNVMHFKNGDEIPEVKTFDEWLKAGNERKPAWCYYNNDPIKGTKFGKQYNWYAVNDPRGLAPEGWCIPSNDQWNDIRRLSIKIAGIDGCGYLNNRHGFMNHTNSWWSSSEVDSIIGSAYSQEFKDGIISAGYSIADKISGLSVLCVRSQFINFFGYR